MPYRKTKTVTHMPQVGAWIDWGDSINQRLKHCWLCNEGAGTVLRDIAGNYDMIFFSTAPTWTRGIFGPAINFTASAHAYTGYDSAAGTARNQWTGDITISIWVYPTTLTDYSFFFTSRQNDWSANGYDPCMMANGSLNIIFRGGGANEGLLSSYFVVNTWHHLVIVQGPNATGAGTATAQAYRNGVLFGTVTNQYPFTQAVPSWIQIGSRIPGTSNGWIGNISNVRLWNRSLTATEVARLYTEPFAGVQTHRRRVISQVATGFKPAWVRRQIKNVGTGVI